MTPTTSDAPLTCDFEGLAIAYDERVLEPRPWTALQSRWAAELVGEASDARLLELCAGAGHIGLLAAHLSGASVVCVDVDPDACDFARANAAAAGLADRVTVRCVPLERCVAPDETPFDVVIADPPWVPRSDLGRFPEDPELAIDGGDDGLDVARACLEHARGAVRRGAGMLLQLGSADQADRLVREAGDLGWLAGELRQGDRGVVLHLVAD
ncbi:MAG: class I SAM-dependent methyltransferase [Nocardioides sp.]|uniref:class I SAM-dependent methyltransferase n=1 Tax=Nocardioides sp. TaxID=35761 RepID=UPI0023855C5B|nr:class I SAM-dependent methyltransferase [Nocardioides sp.]MDE0775833.1 class I SAM-dependent methyltransferase [Nocardioides sp.]